MLTFKGFDFDKLLERMFTYTGIFFNENERRYGLMQHFPPKHPNVFADHITLCYRPGAEYVLNEFRNGVKVFFNAVSYAEDDKGQAVGVKLLGLNQNYRLSNDFLHITISCADGVKPVYSNELMLKAVPLDKPIRFEGYTGSVSLNRLETPPELWKRRGIL